MAQSSREREQTTDDLRELTPQCERPEGGCKDSNDSHAQLDAVEELDVEVREGRSLPQAVGTEKIDKVGRRKIEVDVLQTE